MLSHSLISSSFQWNGKRIIQGSFIFNTCYLGSVNPVYAHVIYFSMLFKIVKSWVVIISGQGKIQFPVIVIVELEVENWMMVVPNTSSLQLLKNVVCIILIISVW